MDDIEQKCIIWKTPAKVNLGAFVFEIDSPRAGGKYQISDRLMDAASKYEFPDDEKIKLTDWLIEKREKGEIKPEILIDIREILKARSKKTPQERTKSLMLYLVSEYKVGEYIDIDTEEAKMMLMAHSSSSTFEEMLGWLRECKSERYLREMSECAYCLEVAGIKYVEGISKEDEQNLQCFVAMWFDENKERMEDVYEKVIEPAIRDAGYEAYRVDKHRHNERIDVKIIEQIKKSRFMIADFTSEEDKPRGGVYYEAGYAHGRGLKVIRTCRKDRIDGVHFDVQHYQHILWKANDLRGFYDEIYLFITDIIGKNENTKEQGASFGGDRLLLYPDSAAGGSIDRVLKGTSSTEYQS